MSLPAHEWGAAGGLVPVYAKAQLKLGWGMCPSIHKQDST